MTQRRHSHFPTCIAVVVLVFVVLGGQHQASAFTIISQAKLGDRSFAAPAVTVGNGQIFVAYTGTDSKHKLNVIRSSDGTTFSPAIQLGNNTSPFAPAIAFFNGQVYVAWTGTDNRELNLAWGDGVNFPNQIVFPSMTALGSPGLGVLDNRLYLAWLGSEGPNRLHVTASSVVTSFPVPSTIDVSVPGRTDLQGILGPPALLGIPGLMVLSYTAADGAIHILAASQGDLSSFRGGTTQNATSWTAPSLAFDATNNLRLASAGPGGSLEITLTSYPRNGDGFVIGGPSPDPLNNTTIANPGIALFNGRLFYFWTGTNNDHNLNVMQIVL